MASPPPLPGEGHSAVLYDGILHIFGGKAASGELLNNVWQVRMQWSDVAALSRPRPPSQCALLPQVGVVPAPRCYHTAHVHGASMYVVHGLVRTPDAAHRYTLPALDLITGEWRCFPTTGDVPPARCHHAGAVVGDELFVIGGFPLGGAGGASEEAGDAALGDADVFALNLESLVWTRIVPSGSSPAPRLWGHSAVPWDRKVVVYGGVDMDTDGESEVLWVWHCGRREWRAVSFQAVEQEQQQQQPERVRAIWDFAARDARQLTLAAGDLIEVLTHGGGAGGGPAGWLFGRLNGKEGWFPGNYAAPDGAGSPAPDGDVVRCPSPTRAIPPPRSSHSACAVDGWGLLVWGGERGDPAERLSDVWLLDLRCGVWQRIAAEGAPPPPSAGLPCVWHGGAAAVAAPALRAVYLLDPCAARWTKTELTVQRGAAPSPARTYLESAPAELPLAPQRCPSPPLSVPLQHHPPPGSDSWAGGAPCNGGSPSAPGSEPPRAGTPRARLAPGEDPVFEHRGTEPAHSGSPGRSSAAPRTAYPTLLPATLVAPGGDQAVALYVVPAGCDAAAAGASPARSLFRDRIATPLPASPGRLLSNPSTRPFEPARQERLGARSRTASPHAAHTPRAAAQGAAAAPQRGAAAPAAPAPAPLAATAVSEARGSTTQEGPMFIFGHTEDEVGRCASSIVGGGTLSPAVQSPAPPVPDCPPKQELPRRSLLMPGAPPRSPPRRVQSAHSPVPECSPAHRPALVPDPGGPGGMDGGGARPSAGDWVALACGAGGGGCLRPGELGEVVAVTEDYTVRGPRGDTATYRGSDVRPPPRAASPHRAGSLRGSACGSPGRYGSPALPRLAAAAPPQRAASYGLHGSQCGAPAPGPPWRPSHGEGDAIV
eukprot:TRINITY_DN3013_c1_g1_i1.p1 TRINITY_DN3013_c1_g1~~TRINITY_DN3013_c1_g1_i1.p1  ORF type:complete len:913 (+),score=189.87 TRINITY_DN3013_c1_g1_i1:94-2739(+)